VTGPFEAVADGVRVRVRVTPKASRTAIAGVVAMADGGHALKVTVTVVPEDGKANDAVIRLLAKAWKLPKSAITLLVGATDRNKLLHVAGDPAGLLRRMTAPGDGGTADA
jgi:uncharacterized protein (TIGR00251 family)